MTGLPDPEYLLKVHMFDFQWMLWHDLREDPGNSDHTTDKME